MTMPDGSGTTAVVPVAKVPEFCAVKPAMVVPERDRPGGVAMLENEIEKFSGGLPAIRAWIVGMSDVNVTPCGGLEPTNAAEPPPARPFRVAFVNTVVRTFVPVSEVILIVPLKSSAIVPAVVVAVPVLVTPTKVSRAGSDGAWGIPARFVIWIGIDPATAREFVVNVVADPPTVAVTKSAGFVWANWRIVTALLDVAIASEASVARARARIVAAFMRPLLKCCRIGMLLNFIERGHPIVAAYDFNQNRRELSGFHPAVRGGLS